MAIPSLDEATRKALNELTEEEASGKVSPAYGYEILGYGIKAVAHAHLMQMARGIAEGRLSRGEFIEKYGLEFMDNGLIEKYGSEFMDNGLGFFAPLEKIESDGIFIPQQAYTSGEKRSDNIVWFFDPDWHNRVFSHYWADKEYALQLLDRKWQPSDLENPELVQQGARFGREAWLTCVVRFDEIVNRVPGEHSGGNDTPAQPKKVTDLGRKLIPYYSALVSEPTH